jgi:hypothetical protein
LALVLLGSSGDGGLGDAFSRSRGYSLAQTN